MPGNCQEYYRINNTLVIARNFPNKLMKLHKKELISLEPVNLYITPDRMSGDAMMPQDAASGAKADSLL